MTVFAMNAAGCLRALSRLFRLQKRLIKGYS